MKTKVDMLFFVVGVILGIALLGKLIEAINEPVNDMQHQAIERGYALYCPADGQFAWVGECEEEE